MIKRIHHFSFTVSNLEDTLKFFCDLLGLEATPVMEIKGEAIEEIVQMPGAFLRISHVITPGKGDVEFIEYVAPEGKKIDLKTCNVGVGHLCFLVDDIQKMYDDLIAKGVQFSSAPTWLGGDFKGWGCCYFKGPDGIALEFLQAPD